jgi:cytosine/adenosine deaminase-related metal-dependent hydrolase
MGDEGMEDPMKADLVVAGGTVMTLDDERRILLDADITVRDGVITGIGPGTGQREEAIRIIDAGGRVVLPGFVNSHCHCLHILMRGGASDLSSFFGVVDWTLNALDPAMRVHTRSDVRLAAQLYAVEAIRSGVTTTAENLDYSLLGMTFDESVDVYSDMGIRVVLGDVFCDVIPPHIDQAWDSLSLRLPGVNRHRPAFPVQETAAALARIEANMRRVNERGNGRLVVCPAPIDPILNRTEGLLAAKDLASRNKVPILIHAAIGDGFDDIPGMSNVQYLDSIGFLGPEVLASHMVQVSTNDIQLLKRQDVRVGYCPASMMATGGGVAPVVEYLNAGLTVGIGTDDPNANQSVNMLMEMKFVALAQNQRYGSNALLPEKALEMATIDGARALGLDRQIGSLEVGKKADIIVCDLTRAHTRPTHNVASVLVYQANGSEVETVIVDGQVLMEKRELAFFTLTQEEEFLSNVQQASDRMLERAGMEGLRDRGWKQTVWT